MDLILRNLAGHYANPEAFPPFGLTVLVASMIREGHIKATRFILKRDLRPSRKAELGRYLSGIDWHRPLNGLECREKLLEVFQQVISTGLDLMPLKRVRINTRDAPWMTRILKRQEAFKEYGTDSIQFKFYRNVVNRKRKMCKAKCYETKVEQMKQSDPKSWWKEVKRLSGARNSSPCSLLSHLDVDELESLPLSEVADYINHAQLESLDEYRLTEDIPKLPLEKDQLPEFLVVTEENVYTRLSHLNPAKAGGPNGIPNWVLREYAEFLAYPIFVILSASFKEQRLPSIWKLADVTPLPKQKPVREIKKDLRPISLTPCISKLAEDFVVTEYVKPAILCMLDPSQFGAIPKSSTTLALLEMLHEWTQGTDGNGATIRTLLFDYKKAFDLIDHSILVRKLCALSIPPINWIIDFLSCRSQRIKLTEGCESEWSTVSSDVS